MCEMQPNSVTNWTTLLNRLNEDRKVSQLMNTMRQYLSAHPALALTALTFSSVAALPVGLFLTFAVVTILMSAVGFLFFEGFLLFVAGLVLLSVLLGIALFSLVVSFIFRVLYSAISRIPSYPRSTKVSTTEAEGRDSEDS